MITIIGTSSDRIRFRYGIRTGTFFGEMMAVSLPGSPDFILYPNEFERWDPPFDNAVVDEATRDVMFNQVVSEFAKTGWVVVAAKNG
jgi:Immunity protein 74